MAPGAGRSAGNSFGGAMPSPGRPSWRSASALACASTAVLGVLLLAALLPPPAESSSAPRNPSVASRTVAAGGIHKIKHVIVIMQENRSFDSYFGTFRGANGIPMRNGVPTVCVPNPQLGRCRRPFLDNSDRNWGGPHDPHATVADVHGGRMDGFIAESEVAHQHSPHAAEDVVGYHDGSSLHNYWSYARAFALQDRMFAATNSWSLPEHLFMVSEWAAECSDPFNAMSCVNMINGGAPPGGTAPHRYAWTDLTYLLHQHHVSWRYYVRTGIEPDCRNNSEVDCPPTKQSAVKAGVWNPLPNFATVIHNRQRRNIKPTTWFFHAARHGTLAAVTWIVPGSGVSEHPPRLVSDGQAYVTRLINAVMRSPQWRSTAIFLSWDDWGGFYDHAVPPRDDINGYGIRVPGIVISPYAKHGYIDHQTLSHDAYVKFIEDDFLGGTRINPRTDGRPDRRPNVRENDQRLGNLVKDFNFNQPPRKPLILPPPHVHAP